MPVTARCRISSEILIWPIALVRPAWTQAPLSDTSPSYSAVGWGGPSAPPQPSWPCPLQGFGKFQKGRSGGEGGRRRGEQIAEGQKRTDRSGVFSWCLHPLDAHHNLPPKGIYPVLPVLASPGRTCAVSLAGWL